MGLFTETIKDWEGKNRQLDTAGGGSLFSKSINSYIAEREAEANKRRGAEILRNATPTLNIVSDVSRNPRVDLKAIDAQRPERRYTGSGEIRAAEQGFFKRAINALPQNVQTGVVDPIREGLFGVTGEEGDRGLLGFLGVYKSETQKITDRIDALKEVGVTDEQATQLAIADVRSKTRLQEFDVLTGGVSEEIEASKEEKKALASAGRWEAIDKAFFVLDVASLGGAKVARQGVREGVRALTKTDRAAGRIIEGVEDATLPLTKRSEWYRRLRQRIDDSWVGLRETVEDDWVRVKRLMREPGVVVDEASDPYTAEVLMSGRTFSRIEAGREVGQRIVNDIEQTARRLGSSSDEVTRKVNDYLISLHAGERIAAVGDKALNITKTQADEILAEIERSSLRDEIKRIAKDVKALHDETLDILKEGGVIKEDLYKTLRNKYKAHVPLQRIMEEDEVASVLTGRGTDVKSTGIRRAKGSEREVADILENVIYNREQAVIRAEKNRVANAIARFAENNKQLGLFEKVKPTVVATTKEGIPVFAPVTDPRILQYYDKGVKKALLIKDAKLAMAFRGINRWKLDPLMRAVGAFTRFYSGLATRFNPEFAFSNKIRDIQEAVIYAAANGQGVRAGRVAVRDPKSMKVVADAIRGIDTADTRLYRQMVEDGGTTGGLALSTKADIAIDIEKMRALARSRPRRAATKALEYIDNWNQVFEDSTRLSVYKEALAQGMSRQRAARMAKESTINFNKMGTGGPLINSLYMFSNASIQGSAKMLRALKNPKVLTATLTGVGAAVVATNEWNDSVDPDWREKVTEWDRLNSLVIMLPTDSEDADYLVIPVSWGIKPIKVAMDVFNDVMVGAETDIPDAVGKIAGSLFEGYNPVGGTDFGQMITPTIGDIPMDIYRNHAWYGGKIAPDWDQYAPDSTRYFDNLRDTATGRVSIAVSKGLSGIGIEISPENIDYAYNQLIGGAGRTVDKLINTVASVGKAEAPNPKDIPFVSRFLRSRPEEEIGAGSEKAGEVSVLLEEQSRERFYANQAAEDAYATMKNSANPSEMFDQLAKRDPELAKKISKIAREDQLGLTYTDRMIGKLGVENGERARFIYNELQEAKTREEKSKIWEYYTSKKIMSPKVAEQVRYLLNQ